MQPLACADHARCSSPPALAASNFSCTIGSGTGAAPAPAAAMLTTVTAAAGDYAGTTLNAEQMKIACTITAVTKQMKLTRRAAEIAL